MKMKPREKIASGMEQLSLPSEVIGASMIEITGTRQILLCGQKGIRTYGEHEIIVDMPDCAVQILGNNLGLITMTASELLIRGSLDSVGFLR